MTTQMDSDGVPVLIAGRAGEGPPVMTNVAMSEVKMLMVSAMLRRHRPAGWKGLDYSLALPLPFVG